jgi:hypothetical protein
MRVTNNLLLINNIGSSGLKFVGVVENNHLISNSSNDPKRFLILSDLISLNKFIVAGRNVPNMSNLTMCVKFNSSISDFIVFNGLDFDIFAVCIIIEVKPQTSIKIEKLFAAGEFVKISDYTLTDNYRIYSITDYRECLKHCFDILKISSERNFQPKYLKSKKYRSPSFFRSYHSFYDIYDQLYK